MMSRILFLTACTVVLIGCDPAPAPVPGRDGTALPEGVEMAVLDIEERTVSSGYRIPWAVEELGAGEYLIVERFGSLYHVVDGERRALEGLPTTQIYPAPPLYFGGYNDVSLHPDFPTNGLVYLAFVDDEYRLCVGRFDFSQRRVEDFEVIFRSNTFSIGSRIAWQDGEHFFLSQGMAGTPRPDPGPQDLSHDAGKIHRLMADGSVPADNPVYDGRSQPSTVWSYGHRDPQGLLFSDGVLYETEHGPFGGDEFNIVERAGNYGWPLISAGLNYDGTPVGGDPGRPRPAGLIAPYRTWGIEFNMAPSGLARLQDSVFPDLDGSFLWGSLAQHRLIGYDPEHDRTRILLENAGRIRDVLQLADGSLMLLIERDTLSGESGRAVVLTPAVPE